MNESEIFMAALDFEAPEERAAYLDKVCGKDTPLRRRVDRLLRSHAKSGSLLEHPAAAATAARLLEEAEKSATSPSADERDGSHVEEVSLDFLEPCDTPGRLGKLGTYEVLEVLGRGGMGLVLKAHDPKLDRIVAVKTLAPELAANPTARKRFLREAQAAAAVSHPHVVTIHAVDEAGNTPYLVMECVEGVTLQEKIERVGTLKLREILRIGSQTAAGLAAAHAQGLIHRDVKPGNILLENSVERVRVSDFGLARAVDDLGVTWTGEVAGTPQHMSPEQAQGKPLDQRSDLFSLGSVLYAMCTGRSPFRAKSAVASMRRVCDDTPRPVGEINPDIPERLAAIIDKLLAKDPNDRFQTAQEVADLLGRYLAHLQHPASTPPPKVPGMRPPTEATLAAVPRVAPARRWPRRAILTAATVMLLLCVALGATEATGVTHLAATILRITTGTGTLVVEVDDPGVSVSIDGEELVITGAGPKELRLKPGQYEVQATKDGRLVKQELVTIQRDGRQVVSVHLEHKQESAVPAGETEAGWVSLFNGRDLTGWQTPPDRRGGWSVEDGVLVGRGGSSRYLFSQRSDNEDFYLRAEARINSGGNSGILFRGSSSQGSSVRAYEAQICADVDGQPSTGSIWKTPPWRCVARTDKTPPPAGNWFTLEVIAHGAHIVVKVNGAVTADYLDEDQPISTGYLALRAYNPSCIVQFRKIEIKELPPGDSEAGVTAPTDLSDYEVRRYVGHSSGVRCVCVLPDGKRVVSGGNDKMLRLRDLKTGAEIRRFEGHSQPIRGVAVLPDGRRLVSGSFDHTVRIWNAETGEALHTLSGHEGQVWDVAALPDGTRVVSASLDKTVRVWDVQSGEQVGVLELDQPVCSVAALPDARHVLCGDNAGSVQLWDVDRASLVRRWEGHTSLVKDVAVSRDGTRALSGAGDGTVRIWSLPTGEELQRFEAGGWKRSALSGDGRLALTSGQNRMFLWDTETGQRLRTFQTPGNVAGMAFVPDGVHAVSGSMDGPEDPGVVCVWELPESLWPEAAVAERLGYLSKSIDADPDDARLFHQRGRLYVRLGRYDEAARDFIRAHELSASRGGWDATSGLFDSLMQREEIFARIAELRPKDRDLWFERGNYLALRGEWDRALSGYARASDYPLRQFEYACALLLAGDKEGYRRGCGRMVERFGQTDDPYTAFTLANVCSLGPNSGIDAGRIAEWAELGLRRGRNKFTLGCLAHAYLRAGRFDETVKLLQEAMGLPESMPKSAAAFPLALAYRALGQEEEGRKWYVLGMNELKSMTPQGPGDPASWAPGHWLGANVWYREAKEVFGPLEDTAPSDARGQGGVKEAIKGYPEREAPSVQADVEVEQPDRAPEGPAPAAPVDTPNTETKKTNPAP